MKGCSDEDLAIYIHFPFCIKKCSYCDFYSLSSFSQDLIKNYVECLIKEIKMVGPKFNNRKIKTVYFGGGTPSLLQARQFSSIMEVLVNSFYIAKDAEISLESNPATIDDVTLKEYVNYGLNRISVGVQSFIPAELKLLGRIHDVSQIYKTVDIIKQVGLQNFNIDLIYGIPNQTLEQWLYNLNNAVLLAPSHISIYLLQLDSHTPLGIKVEKNDLIMLDEEIEREMYYEGSSFLASNGYNKYEISNFSKLGYECLHNLVYWHGREYIGFGAGAVKYIGNKRCINKPNVVEYINCLENGRYPVEEELEDMDYKQKITDALILGLRLTEGINVLQFNQRFNIDLLTYFKEPIDKSINKNLLKIEKGYLKLTKEGYFLSNQVLYHFIGV